MSVRRRKDAGPPSELPPELGHRAGSRGEQLYNVLTSLVPSSVLVIDRNLRVVSANGHAHWKLRRSLGDMRGKSLDQVLPRLLLEKTDLPNRIQWAFQTLLDVRLKRMTYREPGGSLRVFYYSIVPIVDEGSADEAIFVLEDATDRTRLSEEIHQAERRLASVVDSASDIIVSTDAEGRILSWSHAAQASTGYALQEVKGRFLYDLLATEDQPLLKAGYRDCRCLERLWDPEWSLRSADGREIPVCWAFSAMKGEGGTVAGIVAVGRDLRERRRMEAEVLHAQKLAALGVMAGGIAHEIRNPLAVCSAAAQFLMEDDLSPEMTRECAERIVRGIHRASFIIESLLRFARPSAQENLVRLDLAAALVEAIGLAANEGRAHKVNVIRRLPGKPVCIKGDEDMLEHMFLNVFFNAFKAMPEGGTLHVSLARKNGKAVVAIRDTGGGIPKENLDKIFDPFFTTSPVGEGVGLGLSLCYSIAKQHGGCIDVESVEGAGSTFTIRLPLAPAQAGPPEIP